MDVSLLASIQLNRVSQGGEVSVFPVDIARVEQKDTGAVIHFRENRHPPLEVSETVTQVQTAINALWDEYAT